MARAHLSSTQLRPRGQSWGGAEADLFPGALVELTSEQTRPTQPWRVKEIHQGGSRLLVSTVAGGVDATVGRHQVQRHLPQSGVVLEINAILGDRRWPQRRFQPGSATT